MDTEHNHKKALKRKILRVIGIIFAWLSLPVIGLLMLFVTYQSSSVPMYSNTVGAISLYMSSLNGLLGIVLILLLILLTSRLRRKVFFFHLRIGLYIGLGMYGLLMIIGLVVDFNATSNVGKVGYCSSPTNQFKEHGSAVVPIGTDNGYGTGFAVGQNDIILTAYHIIEGSKKIYANYASGEVSMKVIDKAPQYDLALLRIDKPTSNHFNLSGNYQEADEVYTYGYPGNSLTAGPPSLGAGIVSRVLDESSLRMTSKDVAGGLELIQTDAAINPGNSGGPLIGRCGVIGIISFISDTSGLHDFVGAVSEQNIGFAISARTAKLAFPQYLSN